MRAQADPLHTEIPEDLVDLVFDHHVLGFVGTLGAEIERIPVSFVCNQEICVVVAISALIRGICKMPSDDDDLHERSTPFLV